MNPTENEKCLCGETCERLKLRGCPIGNSAPWVAAVVTFLALAATALLLVLAVVYRARIAHFLCPKESLPQVRVCVCLIHTLLSPASRRFIPTP